jgi:hypothetical protein
MSDRLLDAKAIAEKLGVSETWVRESARSGAMRVRQRCRQLPTPRAQGHQAFERPFDPQPTFDDYANTYLCVALRLY